MYISHQGIHWPVSHNRIAGSFVELTKVKCFFKGYRWPGYGFSLSRRLKNFYKPFNKPKNWSFAFRLGNIYILSFCKLLMNWLHLNKVLLYSTLAITSQSKLCLFCEKNIVGYMPVVPGKVSRNRLYLWTYLTRLPVEWKYRFFRKGKRNGTVPPNTHFVLALCNCTYGRTYSQSLHNHTFSARRVYQIF